MKIKSLTIMLASLAVTIAVSPCFMVEAQSVPRKITVVAKRFEFSPSEITVKKGEPVVLVLKSEDVPHGVRFKELGIETKANKGQSSELPFTPQKTGDFVGHCAVFCGAGHGGMTLKLHVVE